ncbi:MAG: efflux RND transporter periplasmic adaptor subunit [Zoogloeaceae bacterium]|jgi:RND family efflux transporter MFP subunit|nr:efflux RND transporter periplasmic adaptor subunit [Zoogloeaceae bacterium]
MVDFSLFRRWRTCGALVILLAGAGIAQAAEVRLEAAQAQNLAIRAEPVTAASALPLTRLPAQVIAPIDKSHTVSTPFAGVVVSVVADEGATVRAGAPLARVQSRDFLAAKADFDRISNEAALAQTQSGRDATLLAEGIIARARADESRARAADAQARLTQARGALAGVAVAADAAAGVYELRAPVGVSANRASRVLRRLIAPGQVVGAFEPAFLLSADDSVDVLVQAPVAYRASYAPGLTVQMDDGASGRVVAVAGATEADSQSVRLRAHLPTGTRWLPGQRTNVRLELPVPAGALRVPVAALLADGERALIFIAEGDRYVAVPVERLATDGEIAIVRGAIEPGAMAVVSGASALRQLLNQ